MILKMTEKHYGIIGSISIHLIIVVIALLVKYTILPPQAYKQIEILQFGVQKEANNEIYQSPASLPSRYSANPEKGNKSNFIPKKVELPKAISEIDEPLFTPQETETAYNSFDSNDKIGQSNAKITTQLIDKNNGDSTNLDDTPVVSASDDYLNSLSNRLMEGSGDKAYILEGEISSRAILSKPMPVYPDNEQKIFDVRIELEVDAKGNVKNTIIQKKAGEPFDSISMDAIKQWIFEPISGDSVQKGTITFKFGLN